MSSDIFKDMRQYLKNLNILKKLKKINTLLRKIIK